MQPIDNVPESDHLRWIAQIYHAYADTLQRFITSKVGDPFLAEDLTSMVFLAGIVFIYDRKSQWPQSGVAGLPDAPSSEIPDSITLLTPRARQVIVLAGDEMNSQKEVNIRPSHLFLGMMNEGSGIGVGLLRSLGVNLLQTRMALAPSQDIQVCSFCGRLGAQVKHIFLAKTNANPAQQPSSICDNCVEQFHSLIEQA